MAAPPPFAAAIAGNRFGLGLSPAAAPPADPAGWLIAQFEQFDPQPAALAGLPGGAAMVAAYRDALRQLRAGGDGANKTQNAAAVMAAQQQRRAAFAAATAQQLGARLALALATPAPFAERLVHFWANHFAISTDKLATATMGGPFENEAIRPHITGRFAHLLGAVLRHPGMLLYLDQAQSVGPGSPLGEAARRRAAAGRPLRRVPGLNENLAREVLELHSVGAGNHSQADVEGLARALTGWSVGGFGRQPGRTAGADPAADGAFVFRPATHQPGTVTVLGRQYPQQGEAQAQAIIDDLAMHPATARHLATKLVRHFIADDPPAAAVDRLAAAYLASGGELMALYRALVAAPGAWDAPASKFKSPWEWLVSALRALDVAAPPPLAALAALRELGQPLWRPGSPAGWPDTAAHWAAPDALLRRVEVASRLAATARIADPRRVAARVLPGVLSPATAAAIARAESPAEGTALLLVSPEFLRR
jgi:uncharacterized protein (DUF1800 family)